MKHYIFDIDGTLTPSRGRIDPEFETFFKSFINMNKVSLVTGSDRPKTLEQIGIEISDSVDTMYQCSGNHIWKKGKEVSRIDWRLPHKVVQWLLITLENSSYSKRTGDHLEERVGLANFSIVGRKADARQRKAYVKYDNNVGERKSIAYRFNEKFGKQLKAQVAGETGIDIIPIGCDKSQILKQIPLDDNIIFFGDKTELGGNDYEIAQAVDKRLNGHFHTVTEWKHTYSILKEEI